MRQDIVPPPTAAPSWRQVYIRFDDYACAEHVGVAHLGPMMTNAESQGLIASWCFTRKAPCWRVRYLPHRRDLEQDTRAYIQGSLDSLQAVGRISQWVETIYEPEAYAFGGTVGMGIAHRLFHQDSRHIVAYLARTAAAGSGDRRRELSILLCITLMRAAGQDWYEQGDIWARLADNRPMLTEAVLPPACGIEPAMRRLVTVDAGALMKSDGPLAYLTDWAAAFSSAGISLGGLARRGALRRGLRAVLTHNVLFHWNRIGLPYEIQSNLARVAKTVVLGHDEVPR